MQWGQNVGFPGADAGDTVSTPGLGISPGEGSSSPFQGFCWETPWTEQPGRGQSAESQSNGEYLHVQHPSPSTEETSKVISELRLTVVPAFLCPRD